MEILQKILDLGASVMMPLIIFIIGIIVGMKPVKAIRAGLTVGIGFIGINLVTGMMGTYMSPMIEGLKARLHLSLTTMDMGWPVSSGIAFSDGSFVLAMFAVIIISNIIMLVIKMTNTLNVDIWNYWHFIMGGSLVYALTGNFLAGCVVGGLYSIIVLAFADRHEQRIEKFLGYPGVTITTQSFPVVFYFLMGIDWIIDRIPGINKIQFSLTKSKSKLSFLTEPMFLGFILGFIISMISGLGWESALTSGVSMAAVMFILPRMVKILMEGLSPLSGAAQEFMSKKFPGRKINIGMDMAILLGDSEVISVAMIMVPITMVLAIILPGNVLLPFTDLAALTYFMVAPVMTAQRNSFRSLLYAVITISIYLLIASNFAPLFTQVGHASGLIKDSIGSVSALSAGGEWIGWILTKIAQFFM